MSFKVPRAPRLSGPTTPSRPTWRETKETPIRKPYGMANTLRPQVDVRTTSRKFAHKPFRGVAPTPSTGSKPNRPQTPTSAHQDKRRIQHDHWLGVIRALIPAYLQLLNESDNLRVISREVENDCGCHVNVRRMSVTVIGFDEVQSVDVCSCSPAKSLLLHGYFPSSPVRPSVAFDVKMLEFARELYLRSPPNRSAWSAAWESFLRGRDYKFGSDDFIRRKFTNALRYFCLLQVETGVHVRKCELMVRALPETGLEGTNEMDDDEWIDEDTLADGDYLPTACPLCFGAVSAPDDRAPADVIVCLDACFVHKRRTPSRGSGLDPPLVHPATVFLSEEEIEHARRMVELARPPKAPDPPTDVTVDAMEPGMKVSQAVLDACSDSFKAADEMRTKASSQFFADTGLMALLCRHDRVLWLANMTTPGERQFYAIALIIKLFKALPEHTTVGVLYDIGCQLHRSCNKWDFIPAYIDRIIWGISVFHAYGHQWPCQLIYHPRKRSGFGLSDGEGCERFWSSIQGLVPSLRVSGYYQRIFTIDTQVEFLRNQGLVGLGGWIARKWEVCIRKMQEAEIVLDRSDLTQDEIGDLWKDQVDVQTRPLVAATASLAKKVLKNILDLMDYVKAIKAEIDALDKDVTGDGGQAVDEAVERRVALQGKKARLEKEIQMKRSALGVTEQQNLRRLLTNKYYQVRVQAKALKDRIQAKLRNRKFELDRLNRSYNQVSASERRLQDHIQSQAARHEPNISNLVKRFNGLCDELIELIRKRHAPRHAVAPAKLDPSTIFSLDVDDAIWSDRGLVGEDVEPPAWLADEEVRGAITAWLMHQRCKEEECYLIREACFLESWFKEEWATLIKAIDLCGDINILAHLHRKKVKLSYVGAQWFKALTTIGLINTAAIWGPTLEDFVEANNRWWGKEDHVEAGSDISSIYSNSEMGEDDFIAQQIELLQLSTSQGGETVDYSIATRTPVSPRKRPRND